MEKSWLSAHLYPFDAQELFLKKAVEPFFWEKIWASDEVAARFEKGFFVRFDDEQGPHVRLRIFGEEKSLEKHVRPAVKAAFDPVAEVVFENYEPEIERFGAEKMAACESHFHASSELVLKRTGQNETRGYADSMSDALAAHLLFSHAAGLSRAETRLFFFELFKNWQPVFFKNEAGETADFEATRRLFEASFLEQKDGLEAFCEQLWTTLDAGDFDALDDEWQNWHEANLLILSELDRKTWPDLAHLTNNRFGITNQDEVFLNYLVAHAL